MGIKGSNQYGRVTYRRIPCAICGREFSCPSSTKYKTSHAAGYRYYCSYTCYRKVTRHQADREKRALEIEEERAAREIYLEALRKKRVYLRHRLEQTREKVAFYTAQRAEHEKGTPEWEAANKLLVKWREKRKQANQDLDDLARIKRERGSTK